MKRRPDIEGQEIIERLRYAFPELGEATLQSMAAFHPEVIRAELKHNQKRNRRPSGITVIRL